MRLAVIDLGTNTCNLLIAEIYNDNYNIVYQGKVGVKIGKAGIHKKLLTDEAFERAYGALKIHKETIENYKIDEVIAIATSAVRDADNKEEFINYLQKETGIQLQVISGNREAQLIFKGVQLAIGPIKNGSLILDIGGGSNEFILPNESDILWKESFPLGMSRVIEEFHISDPISASEIKALEDYFTAGLAILWKTLEDKKIDQLIGCSGAFDTIVDLIDQTPPGTKSRISQKVSINEFHALSTQIIHSTQTEREKMIGMEPLRVEMIVPAFILIKLIVDKLRIENILQTDYALREGVLYEYINR
ncbi:Ppx/GppA phosphatase family protein [Sunxiuqinia sp. A32]|uniref:Ppx/GppA phosphatase family protein n=1 Tax=Sunxiuqinia sp. A32 TaxID=3461496 RepID=UPI004045EB8C